MLKYVVVLLILIAALAGIFAIMPPEPGPATDATTQAPVDDHAASDADRPSAWTFEDAGGSDITQTRVTVDLHGEFVLVGEFEGNCADMRGSAWALAPGASEGALCWFAGGGTEIAVFHEGGKHVIKASQIEEGTAEGGGGRGEFVTLLAL